MNISLTQFRAFIATVEYGTYTAAAGKLDVSQASVSEAVTRLEEELDVKLFVRSGRKMIPTNAGHHLFPHAKATLTRANEAVDAVSSLESLRGGVATFGMPRNAAYYGLAKIVNTFHHKYPAVRIRMVGMNSFDVAEAVATGDIEAGLVVLPVLTQGLRFEPLLEDEVLYASMTCRPKADKAEIDELVASGPVLYDAHSGWNDPTRHQLLMRCNALGISITPTIEVEQADSALSLVASGIGATIVSASLKRADRIPENVQTWSFREVFTESLALVTRENTHVSRATSALMKLVRESLMVPKPSV